MSHPETATLRALAEGELSRAEAVGVRSHALGCDDCRRALAAVRPAAVFAPLGADRPAPVDWSRFHARLRASLDAGRTAPAAPSAFRPARGPLAAVLAAAAALVLAVLVPVLRTGDFVTRYAAEQEALHPVAVPASELPAELLAALDSLEEWAPAVEGVESPTAEVVEFASVFEEGVQVVLIVDEDLEL